MVLMITAMIVVIIHVINLPDESWMVTSRNPVTGRDEAPLGHWIVGSHDTVIARNRTRCFMQYLISLWSEFCKMSQTISECFARYKEGKNIYIIVMACAVAALIYCAIINVIFLSHEGKDTNIGTAIFWVIFVVFTFGFGTVIFQIIENVTYNRVYKRNFLKAFFIILPTAVTALATILFYDRLAFFGYGNAFPTMVGMTYSLMQTLAVILFLNNKRICIQIPENVNEADFVNAIGNSKNVCRTLKKNKDMYLKLARTEEKIRLDILSKETMDESLLLDENQCNLLIRKYRKPTGETIKVVELGGNTVTKIYCCLAGMMLMVLVTTPYIPYVIESFICAITRRV